MKQKKMCKLKIVGLAERERRLFKMYLYEIGYTLEDVGTIAAVRETEVKKLKKFVELLNGSIEILDTWEVANYF